MAAKDLITIPKLELHHLQSSLAQLKCLVKEVLDPKYVHSAAAIPQLQQENTQLMQELENLKAERDHWHSRCEAAFAETESFKAEKLSLRCEVQELSHQMAQQSEYCASMGSAACTLLWRVSRSEESIQAMLAGSKIDEFLKMVSSTLESYIQTYEEEVPVEQAEETQFILALCGTITNIAASALGREFLITNTNGQTLIDLFICSLSNAPNKTCSKMKNLILMCLYNLSINQKGLLHLSSNSGLLSLLVWLIQEEKAQDNRLNALRLIQSLLHEQTNRSLIQEAKEVVTVGLLQDLSTDPSPEIRETALELLSCLRICSEP